ncbi:MAG: OB-fold nucleic acid binding domain-containing protein, partial [Patescibacteria group bacterium]
DGAIVRVGGSITQLREITTKNGSRMAFAKIADQSGEIELVIFPKIYKMGELTRDSVVIVKGRVNSRGRFAAASDELKVIADKIEILSSEEAENYQPRTKKTTAPLPQSASAAAAVPRLYIRIEDSEDQIQLMALKHKLDDHRGETEVVIVTGPSESKQVIKLPQMVSLNEQSLRDLAAVFGPTNVVVR